MAHFENYKPPPDISPPKPPYKRSLDPQVLKVLIVCFCLLVFCLLVFCFCFFFCFLCISPSKVKSGKIKCVTFCCVTQTKQACKLSAQNYRFEILQRIQIKKRRLIGENCFEVQVRQNHFIPEGS